MDKFKSLKNNPILAGKRAIESEFYGKDARYELFPVFTRGKLLQWVIEDTFDLDDNSLPRIKAQEDSYEKIIAKMGTILAMQKSKIKFNRIPQRTRNANYNVHIDWEYLKDHIKKMQSKIAPLDLEPDFQRGHVWTREQKIAYVEFKLSGGAGSNDIFVNCVGWMHEYEGPHVLVDGKQRIQAVLDFLDDKIPAFGYYFSEYEGLIPSHCCFNWRVNDLKTRKEVLQWYLEMNTGGTPHSEEEINRVKNLLNKEK